MAAIHQLVGGVARCGAEILPPREGAHTMWPCQPCRIRELEDALRYCAEHSADTDVRERARQALEGS